MTFSKRFFSAVLPLALMVSLGAAAAQAQSSAPVTAPPAAAPAAPDASAPVTAPPAATSAPDTTPPAAGSAPDTTPPAGSAPDTTPPVAPPAPDASAAPATDANPYGLAAFWATGDLISRGVLVILVLMSMSSWYVLITKGIQQSLMFAQYRKVEANFWQAPSVRAAAAGMQPGTAFAFVAQSGVESLEKHPVLLGKIDIHSFSEASIQDSVETVQSRMQEGLALLGTVASTAPFVGLFGTVWGILKALTAIGIAGQASIDKVAGPVGESLIMTAIGLAVAVPAVFGYNFLVRRNKRGLDMVRKFAKKVLFVLLSSDAAGA
jgi:biopolymer transport protein ExbB